MCDYHIIVLMDWEYWCLMVYIYCYMLNVSWYELSLVIHEHINWWNYVSFCEFNLVRDHHGSVFVCISPLYIALFSSLQKHKCQFKMLEIQKDGILKDDITCLWALTTIVAFLRSTNYFPVLTTNLLYEIIFLCVENWSNYSVRLRVLRDCDQLWNRRCNQELVGCTAIF